MAALSLEKEERDAAEERLVQDKGIKEGARCEVAIQGAGKRRGTVR